MASKTWHVQDSSIVERRLRPIYEWLDNGVSKKALQECDKVLKKTPNLQCAKALKAVALLRLGKESECMALLDSLIAEKPCDDATLQAISLCYRELQQLEKVCRLYEMAIQIDKTNEELYSHLFMSYVRVCNFKAQQQTAMALYKLRPRNPYYCWAVMSIIMQATRGPDAGNSQKCNLLLSLAERMINKMISDNKMEAEQEAQLYIMILELQNKFEQILDVFDGPLGLKLVNGSLSYNKLPYLMRLNRWKEVNLFCKSVLVDNVDKWNIWLEYINSVFELMSESYSWSSYSDQNENGSSGETVDDTSEKAHEFICSLIESGYNGYSLRGPYLARLELCLRLKKRNTSTVDLLGETVELFVEYFRKFGHKPCCVSDLRTYLWLLDTEVKLVLCDRLIKDVNAKSGTVANCEQQMQRHIGALQLSRLCGVHATLDLENLRSVAEIFSMHYQLGFERYGMGLLSTDQGPSDPYAILAVHVLYDVAQTTQSSEPVILALVLLEKLLKNSQSSFHAKLLAVKLYHMLGGATAAHSAYNSLDVKHLQLDSLGYVHCARLPTTGLLSAASPLYEGTLKFFSTNYKDSSDHMTFSYKFGSFVKLNEFMDFRDRLNNSLHYAVVSVERIMLSLMNCSSLESLYGTDLTPKDDEINWAALRNNHDISVYLSWDPRRIQGPPEEWDETKELFAQDVKFLELRTNILYLLSSGLDIVKSADGMRQKHIENVHRLLSRWETIHETVREANYAPITQKYINLPLPSRLHAFLSTPYVRTLTYLFKLFMHLASDEPFSGENLIEQIKESFEKQLQVTSDTINSHKNTKDVYWERRYITEEIVNSIELVSLSSIVLVLTSDLVKPSQGKKVKKKAADLKSREMLGNVIEDVREVITTFMTLLDSCLCEDGAVNDISSKVGNLNIECVNADTVRFELNNSHATALKELKTVLENKNKMLLSLQS